MLFKVQCQGPSDSIWCTEAEIENEFPAYAIARSKSMGRGVSCRLVADDGQVVSQVSPTNDARRLQSLVRQTREAILQQRAGPVGHDQHID